jgi:hypothetical protein
MKPDQGYAVAGNAGRETAFDRTQVLLPPEIPNLLSALDAQ